MDEAVEHLTWILPKSLDSVNLGLCSGAMCVGQCPCKKSPNYAVMISLHQFAVLGLAGEKGVRVKADSLKGSIAKYSSLSSFSVRGEWRKPYLLKINQLEPYTRLG